MLTQKVDRIKLNSSIFLRYKLCGGGIEARIFNHGGIIHKLLVPDKDGKVEDIVLGYDTPKGSIYTAKTVIRVYQCRASVTLGFDFIQTMECFTLVPLLEDLLTELQLESSL